ncbi:type II secretion system protein [Candidatus Berkelbacteria bacterium]|nr:type II secretion system protein [Candidatus Berkelbacteria bacterium]
MVKCSSKGFTLVEMMVSVGIFTIILFLSTSALLSIVSTDRKSRAVRIAMDNLNLALEDMTRKIKTGSMYYCGIADTGGVADCAATSYAFSFTAQDGVSRISYQRAVGDSFGSVVLGTDCGPSFAAGQGCIMRSDGATFMLATSPEVDIKGLRFLVTGSALCGTSIPCVSAPPTTDAIQPVVVVLINGAFMTGLGLGGLGQSAGKSEFRIQSTVTQRAYDN